MLANILDPKWKYFRSEATDLRRTFARIRREQEAAKKVKPPPSNITKMVKK